MPQLTTLTCARFVLDLSDADIADLPSKCQTAKEFSVEKTYLAPTGTGPNGTHFVRRRWSPAAPNLVAFGLTSQLKSLEGDGMEETKQIITEHLCEHFTLCTITSTLGGASAATSPCCRFRFRQPPRHQPQRSQETGSEAVTVVLHVGRRGQGSAVVRAPTLNCWLYVSCCPHAYWRLSIQL